MGARPLRRAIQRYIEDPLADEVLSQSMPPGSTIEVDKAPEDDESDVTITDREAQGAQARDRGRRRQGRRPRGGLRDGSRPRTAAATTCLDEPEVLPDVPDAPPAPDGEAEPE